MEQGSSEWPFPALELKAAQEARNFAPAVQSVREWSS
jgi:hypothetical protein